MMKRGLEIKKCLIFLFLIIYIFSALSFINAISSSVSIISPNGNENWKGAKTVTWNAIVTDPAYKFYIYAWKDGNSLNTYTIDVSGLAYDARETNWNTLGFIDGLYKVRVMMWDPNNGVEVTSDISNLMVIDNTKPTVSISGVSGSWTNSDSVILNCADDISGCLITRWYYFDNDGSCSSNKIDYVNSISGGNLNIDTTHNDYLCLWVEDNSGNSQYTTTGSQLKVDATNPTASLSVNPIGLTNQNIASYTPDCSDSGNSGLVSCITYVQFNNGDSTIISTTEDVGQAYNMNNDGIYTFYTIAIDNAGNNIPTSNYNIERDSTAPTISITNAPTTTWNVGSSVDVLTNCNDFNAQIKYYYSDTTLVCSTKNFDSDYVTSNSATKPYVCAVAKDNAGNIGYSNIAQFKISPTIQGAINSASAGDTINIGPGIYTESVNLNKNVIIKGSGDSTIIQPAINEDGFTLTADGITIQDLKINLETSGVDAQAIRLEGANSVIILNNNIETTGDKGIGIWVGGIGYSNSNNLKVIGNTIIINDRATGIYAEGGNIAQSGWEIKSNTITAISSNPLELYDVSDSEVSDNILTIISPVDASNVMWFSELSDIANLVFKNNILSGSSGSEVAIGTDFRNDGPFADSPSTSINTVTITGNSFSNWGSRALRIGKVGIGSVTGVNVNNNKFLSSGQALNNFDNSQINAENNWWGTTSPASLIFSGNIDYTPWAYDSNLNTDNNAPTITISSPNEGTWNKNYFSVSVIDSDNGAAGLNSCKYRILSDGIVTKDWTIRICSDLISISVGIGNDCRNEGVNKCKIELSAIDNSGNENINERTFSIDWTNPAVNAGADKVTKVQINQDATVADATSSIVNYQWTKISGPGIVTFGTGNTEDTTIQADTDGVYVIRLTAIDSVGNSAYDEISFTWDTTGPATSDNYPNNNAWVNSAQVISLNPYDTTSGIALTKYCLTSGCDPSAGTEYNTAVALSTEEQLTLDMPPQIVQEMFKLLKKKLLKLIQPLQEYQILFHKIK